jgi:hypothetical protein
MELNLTQIIIFPFLSLCIWTELIDQVTATFVHLSPGITTAQY